MADSAGKLYCLGNRNGILDTASQEAGDGQVISVYRRNHHIPVIQGAGYTAVILMYHENQ